MTTKAEALKARNKACDKADKAYDKASKAYAKAREAYSEAIAEALKVYAEASKALPDALAEQPAQQEPVAYIEHDDETAEPCPSCGKPLQSASGGGVVCSGRCGYWFCF